MKIYVSTNMYRAEDFPMVLDILNAIPDEEIGVEVFPMFHVPAYEAVIDGCMEELKQVPITFHGPYYQTEHSAKKGTEAYERSMNFVKQSMGYCNSLQGCHMVFHHNNCVVTEENKADLIGTAQENLAELNELAKEAGITWVVENAGVKSRRNMLLNEAEFIAECLRIENPILIDIGHAYANGWDLECVIETLQDRIVAYHVHNNDGYEDNHDRIYQGINDFDEFLKMHQMYTPDADLVLEYSVGYTNKKDAVIEDLQTLCAFRKKCIIE